MNLELGQLSLGMETGQILRWLVADGDLVEAGQVILEVETDKATAEVEAPGDGRITIVAAEGETIAVGGVLATIDEGGQS